MKRNPNQFEINLYVFFFFYFEKSFRYCFFILKLNIEYIYIYIYEKWDEETKTRSIAKCLCTHINFSCYFCGPYNPHRNAFNFFPREKESRVNTRAKKVKLLCFV